MRDQDVNAPRRYRVVIGSDGQARSLAYDRVLDLVKQTGADMRVERASHVHPRNYFKRQVFRCLRILFGDSGKVADWTRSWLGKWQVDFRPSGGTIVIVNEAGCELFSHADAVVFERRVLEREGFQLGGKHAGSIAEAGRDDLHR